MAAAIKTAEDGGLSSLSMRSLAQQLDVTPMALYAHVADKDEILDEILDSVLEQQAPPRPATSDWRAWMVGFAEQLHEVLTERPELLARFLRRPVGVRTTLRRMEAALAVLHQAGFDDADAIDLFATVQSVTVGFTALEVARREDAGADRSPQASVSPDPRSPHYWPMFFAGLAEQDYPHLSRVRPDLNDFSTPHRFRGVLITLLAGLNPPKRRAAPSRTAAGRLRGPG